MNGGREEVNLARTLRFLKRRALLIVLLMVLAGGAAFAYSMHQTKQYTATASLVFGDDQFTQQVAGLQPASTTTSESQQATNAQLVQLGDMAAKTARRLGHGLTGAKVREDVSISSVGTTSVVNVAATSASPSLAAAIANTYSRQFVKEQKAGNRRDVRAARAVVNRRLEALTPAQRAGPTGTALQDRAESLAILALTPSGGVKIAQPASIPESPSSPQTARNTVIAAILGLLIGLAVALLLERIDRRIREPKDLEEIYQLPLLGAVPDRWPRPQSNGGPANGRGALPRGTVEAFRSIHAHLHHFPVGRELQVLLLVSAVPGEGKARVAHHLAETAAATGRRTLLIEADLRGPKLARELGIEPEPGLADVLGGSIAMSDAVRSVKVGAGLGGESTGYELDVLVAGKTVVENPAALIDSSAMHEVIELARSVYDAIVIDTSPLGIVSDAVPLLSRVDGAIIVGRVGSSRRDVAERLHGMLMGVQAPLVGIVASNVDVPWPAPRASRGAT